jgi:PAS domain-containing protein
VPEPRNYRAWRDEIARVERGAEQDSFHELWTLPTGETVRVTGRPYPDGGIAFMFEDITSEMSLTRKFRGELDLYRAVFDAMPDALAVFSADGKLLFGNAGYKVLWGVAARPQDATEALRHWQTRLVRRSGLTKLRAFLTGKNPRVTPTVTLHLSDGQSLSCRTALLPGGARLVRFAEGAATEAVSSDPTPLEADAHERGTVYEVAEAPGKFEPHRSVARGCKPTED